MASAQILFDPNWERAILRAPGKPDMTGHLRDEAEAARFAHEAGYVIIGPWEITRTTSSPSTYWECATLREAA